MATGNMHKNMVKFGHTVFMLCVIQTDKQTYRQTHIFITILRNPIAAK